MKYLISAQTHTGLKRTNNEDNLCVNSKYMRSPEDGSWGVSTSAKACVVAVCDGMGGERFGEFASLCAAVNIACCHEDILNASEAEQAKRVDVLIRGINQQICDEILKRNARIGSTLAMLCIKNGVANLYNIGDSRVYLLRNGALTQLSKDHTIAQQKLELGAITAEQAKTDSGKHTLTQHLGIFESEMLIDAHHVQKQVQPDDVFLLCSDGLTDMVSDEAIQQILVNEKDCESAVKKLIATALENGGKDNVSVIVIQAKGAFWG